MPNDGKRPLKVFLCHASGDKPPVRDLYKRLTIEGVDAWLDKEKLLPGQDWRMEIPKAVRDADVVVICLSNKSVTKEGYVQKEIKFALDIAEEKPDGTIFLIPARLEDCPVPERLSRWQWVDLHEENGFVQLLRSLKLRAEAVGATVEPISYVDSDKETERRLERLYTEGLAAFYTEDWDRACQRFQSILSERPTHKTATEKLGEAERQRNLAKLYGQGTSAVRSADWKTAIQILEELSSKSTDYKDAAQLLRNARKQKQLGDLYAEAKALHAGKQWEAVVKVFEQVLSIDPGYPDTDGLLPSAQKEVAELKYLAALNDRYSCALREMEVGNWYEARKVLESIHKSQTGFLETEKLLKKVEGEIAQQEEKRRQNDQVNTLYEQAHGLLRSKKWRNALEKLDQIQKLDEHFPDADGITNKAHEELAREEQEAERQNKLAAIYAEAVKLLKEGEYQDALDKWQDVKALDPKYPDRQWVQRTARRKLSPQPVSLPTWLQSLSKGQLIFGGGTIVLSLLVVIVLSIVSGKEENTVLPILSPTKPLETPTRIIPSPTNSATVVVPTATIPIPTATMDADPSVYDNFNNPEYDGKYNIGRWKTNYIGSGDSILQQDGILTFKTIGNSSASLEAVSLSQTHLAFSKPTLFQVEMKLDSTTKAKGAIFLEIRIGNSTYFCSLYNNGRPIRYCHYYNLDIEQSGENIALLSNFVYGDWYLIGMQVDMSKRTVDAYFNGQRVGSHPIPADEPQKISVYISVEAFAENTITGYVDNFRILGKE